MKRDFRQTVVNAAAICQNPRVYPAWRAQCLSRLADPVFIPLGGASVCPAWRTQGLSRLAGPAFIPLGGPRVYPAWRAQCLSRLADPVFIPLGGASVYPAWRAQCLSHLAGPVFVPLGASPAFIPLGGPSIYPAWWAQCLPRLVRGMGIGSWDGTKRDKHQTSPLNGVMVRIFPTYTPRHGFYNRLLAKIFIASH